MWSGVLSEVLYWGSGNLVSGQIGNPEKLDIGI